MGSHLTWIYLLLTGIELMWSLPVIESDLRPVGIGLNRTVVALLCHTSREDAAGEITNSHIQTITAILNDIELLSEINYTTENITIIQQLNDYMVKADNHSIPESYILDLCTIIQVLLSDSSGYTINDTLQRKIDSLRVRLQNDKSLLSMVRPAFDYVAFRQEESDEQRLLNTLMTNYEKAVRPVLKASQPVELKIGLTLNQIDVDEKNQVLTVLVWLDQQWTDEKLIWEPANYSNLEVLRVPCAKIWLPDIVLYNSVEDLREGYMQALAMVTYDGTVFWPPIVKYKGNCEIKIKYFPFDDQICHLKLGTWAYDGFQVNVTKRKEGIDLSNYQSNGEWELLRTQTVRNEKYYNCCPEPYIDVTFFIYLQRRTLYYVYNIIIPCIMLSILTLLSFWMKPDSGEKINLGLTILLAFSVFMLLIAESMPSTSFHVPIIGIYITLSMCLTAFSVVSAVFVANINHQAEGDRIVPYWIHKICHTVGRIVCVKMVSWEERHCNIRQLAKVALPGVKANMKTLDSSSKNRQNGHVKGESEESKNTSNPAENDPLLKRLHTIVEHQEELLHKQNSSEDWHSVAIIIDRCLFWVYALMMASTMIGCLLIFPSTKESISGEGDLEEPL